MTFLLGPAPCKGCRKHVFYDGRTWCDPVGLKHVCKPGAVLRLKRVRSVMWTRNAA